MMRNCSELTTNKKGKETNHVESRFREVVVLAGDDFLEGTDGVLEGDEFAFETSENLSDLERLGHETLDFAGTFDLVFAQVISNPSRSCDGLILSSSAVTTLSFFSIPMPCGNRTAWKKLMRRATKTS